jgi:hypothetical protein
LERPIFGAIDLRRQIDLSGVATPIRRACLKI